MEETQNPKCKGCLCYWKPDESDIKPSGITYKTCKKCRDKKCKYGKENVNKIKEHKKQYYIENCDKIKEQKKQNKLDNPDKIKEYYKQYREENKYKIKEYYKQYCLNNPDKLRNKHKQYIINIKENNPMRYLAVIQRTQITKCLKLTLEGKKGHSVEYLGCSYEDFHKHIETKINNWNTDNPDNLMDFTNIHIDHIKPISRFNFTDEEDGAEELLDCCNYTNLQPLLAIDNLSKNNRWTDENEAYWIENIKGNIEYNKVYIN
jgi:hypothetical protein